MKLVSWNLNGLEDEQIDRRTEAALFQILLGAPIEHAVHKNFIPKMPDIVLLQEVVPHTFHSHLIPHFKAAGFTLFPKAPSERSYFEVIAVRDPIQDSNYSTFSYTAQGRGLSSVSINGLTIFTAHLESERSGSAMRIDQTKEVLNIMHNHDGACIFGGDTNLRDKEWQDIMLNDTNGTDIIKDAWTCAKSPKNHKTTWQMNNAKARFDRIWHKGCEIKHFETFGKENVPLINERSSDHLGLRVNFKTL